MENKNRLTESDDLGNWGVKGLLWKNLYEGEVITREIHEKLYGCLAKLKDYEETELSPEDIKEIDRAYSEQAKELSEVKKENEKLKGKIEAIRRLYEK